MVRYFIYALSGQGVVPARSRFMIILLKKAGVIFPHYPKFENLKGEFLFHPIREISQDVLAGALALLQAEGISGAAIGYRGNYLK